MVSEVKGISIAVVDLDGKESGSVALNADVFGQEVRADLLHRMVNYQLANRRQGTHKVKSRGEVKGSTRKQFRQKGTGNARRGDGKVAQFRGGGLAFGPKVRNHNLDMPKKVRQLALKVALSVCAGEGRLVVLEQPTLDVPKTKLLQEKLGKLNWGKTLVISSAEFDRNFSLAARNLVGVDLLSDQGANVYDILCHETLVLTKDAVDSLTARLAWA
ncbi:MAG: 50S ribosomal protein L4 [Alphaproteobacteria bacterium]|nr:50S ribosomal protein L4 [Alphaproteobacteria bacterium]